MIKFILNLSSLLILSLMLASCGSDGGAQADFNTVSVFVSSATTSSTVESDAVKAEETEGVDANNDGDFSDPGDTSPTVEFSIPVANFFTYNFTVSSNTSSASQSSAVNINRIRVVYTKVPNYVITNIALMPDLLTSVQPGQILMPGTTPVAVEIVPQSFKSTIFNAAYLGDVYTYRADIYFDLEEISTGKTKTITRSLDVKVADYSEE